MLRICAALVVVSVASLGGAQGQEAPREPTFYAGKWEVAAGSDLIAAKQFNRILELNVEGTKVIGTITLGSRTVKVAGEVNPDGILSFRTEIPRDSPEAENFLGGVFDGQIIGTYFHTTNGTVWKTGWAARRPPAQ